MVMYSLRMYRLKLYVTADYMVMDELDAKMHPMSIFPAKNQKTYRNHLLNKIFQ